MSDKKFKKIEIVSLPHLNLQSDWCETLDSFAGKAWINSAHAENTVFGSFSAEKSTFLECSPENIFAIDTILDTYLSDSDVFIESRKIQLSCPKTGVNSLQLSTFSCYARFVLI